VKNNSLVGANTSGAAVRSIALLLMAVAASACAAQNDDTNSGGTAPVGGAPVVGGEAPGGMGGSAGGSPCEQDCSLVEVAACYEATCNAETGLCEVGQQADGEDCEDGLFCTAGDTCMGGLCGAGGMTTPCEGGSNDPCTLQQCDEDADACLMTGQQPNGTACESANACVAAASCQNGVCLGPLLNCTLEPVPNECNVSQCDPLLGVCAPVPGNNGLSCSSFGDPCMENKTCLAGDCQGGITKVCPSDGCNNGVCDALSGACSQVPVGPGQACFAGIDVCNNGECNAAGQCIAVPGNNGAACDDGSNCTINDDCSGGICLGDPDPNTVVYFTETFASNAQGWTLGPDWAIGSAAASSCGSWGADPAADHTISADNGIAGVILGGCYSTALHADYCITSPVINASAPGSVVLSYWRHLHTDYPSYISSHVDVSSNSGGSWSPVYSVPSGVSQNDAAWTLASFDVTAQKSATMQVRFCYSAGPNSGIIAGGGWNIDDVTLATALCN